MTETRVIIDKTTNRLGPEQLDIAIGIINMLYSKEFIDTHEKMAEVISSEFQCKCTQYDINAYYSPSIEGIITDKLLQAKHLGLTY